MAWITWLELTWAATKDAHGADAFLDLFLKGLARKP